MQKLHKIIIAGDLFPVPQNIELFKKGDINSLFGEKIIKLFKEADFSIVNFEGTITDQKEAQKKAGPIIMAPRASINGVKELGVSALALANNHTTDANHQGVEEMLNTLKDAGIDYVGCGTKQNMKKYLSLKIGSKKICIYNVSETFFNSPTDNTIGAHLYDEWIVCNEIKNLKQSHDYLVVIYHGGSEYFRYPTPIVSQRCHRMADCGADIITTQHTHCIGCEEYYHNTYILHGQGNFCFGVHRSIERQKITQKGIILEIVFDDNSIKIKKHLSSIYDNTYIRYDDIQDFSDFDSRSRRVAAGEEFSKELLETRFQDIAHIYIDAYKGKNIILKIIKKYFPSKYKKILFSSYTKKQVLLNLSTLQGDRRNEEMKLVWKYIYEKFAQ